MARLPGFELVTCRPEGSGLGSSGDLSDSASQAFHEDFEALPGGV